jgi:hypothetical protein
MDKFEYWENMLLYPDKNGNESKYMDPFAYIVVYGYV